MVGEWDSNHQDDRKVNHHRTVFVGFLFFKLFGIAMMGSKSRQVIATSLFFRHHKMMGIRLVTYCDLFRFRFIRGEIGPAKWRGGFVSWENLGNLGWGVCFLTVFGFPYFAGDVKKILLSNRRHGMMIPNDFHVSREGWSNQWVLTSSKCTYSLILLLCLGAGDADMFHPFQLFLSESIHKCVDIEGSGMRLVLGSMLNQGWDDGIWLGETRTPTDFV